MKKFLSLVVAALLTVSAMATSASAAKFTDVDASNEALNDAVELLTALNVTKGTTETTFGTTENVTRQQMAAFIYRMMKAGKSQEGGVNTTSFVDLDDPTFYFMVSWANSQGIIKGRSATEFDPKGGIILQDAYTMIVRALGYDDGTLSYPIDYIELAESLGLDEDLPSSVAYSSTLTRGDVAIILANMFYAETAEVEIKYETSYKVICVEHNQTQPCADNDGEHNYQAVSNGQVPKEYRKTVAEAVFEVEKVTQRVVATANYSLDGAEKPDEDVEMIVLTKDEIIDYPDETGIPSLNQVEFADLGLEGKADDYFLKDIVMFVREVKDGEYEIFGATTSGTVETVAFEDVDFGTVTGTTSDKYYDGAEKDYKIINGKVTLGDTVTYLFDAPYSFTKDYNNPDKYTPKFIELADYEGDVKADNEEDFIDYNYVTNDVTMDETIIGWYMNEDDVWVKNYDAYLAQVYFGGLGEIDVYDCDGDGKPEYLFVKNYVVGTIDDAEDENATDIDDITAEADALKIYTDKALVDVAEGVTFADDDVVLAYVCPEANYVKVVEVLNPIEATLQEESGEYFVLSTGEKVFFENAEVVVANGTANLADIDNQSFNVDGTYYFTADNKLVYMTDIDAAFSLDAKYSIVLEDTATLTTSINADGKLEKANYIEIYYEGETKTVKVKSIADYRTQADKEAAGESAHVKTPLTVVKDGDTVVEEYSFTAYKNRFAVAKADKKGAYYFELVDFTTNNNVAALAGDDEAGEYRVANVQNVELFHKTGNIYEIDNLAAANEAIQGVYVTKNTKIILKTLDEDGEPIITTYGYDNLPDIAEGTEFDNVSYVVYNNVNSTKYENLAIFYGVLDAELEGDKGDFADVRIIASKSKSSTEDGTVYTYTVYDPMTGKEESGIQGSGVNTEKNFDTGYIVSLTSEGYINDEINHAGTVFAEGTEGKNIYNVDGDYNFDQFNNGENAPVLGYVEVANYDEANKFLEIVGNDDLLQVDDETVVTFYNRPEKTVTVVDAEVLASTSKTYREEENKNNNIRVFLCIEEDEDFKNTGSYDVKFAMIVRNK